MDIDKKQIWSPLLPPSRIQTSRNKNFSNLQGPRKWGPSYACILVFVFTPGALQQVPHALSPFPPFVCNTICMLRNGDPVQWCKLYKSNTDAEMLMWFMYIYALPWGTRWAVNTSHKYGAQAEWSRKAVFAVWRKRKLDLLSPISCGQVISTFPPEQQHLHEILTGTKFTSNVTSLIVNRGQQVPGCKGGRWPGCSWISNGVNERSNLYLSVFVYTVR